MPTLLDIFGPVNKKSEKSPFDKACPERSRRGDLGGRFVLNILRFDSPYCYIMAKYQ